MLQRSPRLWLLAAVALAAGCRTPSLQTHPFADRAPAHDELWDVAWWVKLVAPKLMEYEPRELATPAMDADTHRVVVLTRDGYVRSFAPDGRLEWKFKTRGHFNAGATVDQGVVYVPGADGFLYALKSRTGELLWKYDAGEELGTRPVVAGGRVLVASQADTLFAVEAQTGKWVWQHRRDAPAGFTIRGVSEPVVSAGAVFMGFADGTFTALDAADGTLRWERPLAMGVRAKFPDVDTGAVVDEVGGRVYVASYQGGLYALDAQTGAVLWRDELPGLTGLLLDGDVLYATGDRKAAAFTPSTGARLWLLQLKEQVARQPVLAGGHLVVPANEALLFLDPLTGRERVRWDPGQGVSATPLWTGQDLVVLSNLGWLYALHLPARGG